MTLGPPTADPRTIEAYARELVGKGGTGGTGGKGDTDRAGEARLVGSRVLALAADPAYHGPSRIDVDGTEVTVHGCVSALAVREALVGVPEGGFAILLTDRPVADLGDSLVARFRRQRVEPLDSWTTVPGMFAGRYLDAGLRHSMPWLPELLFEWMPPGGYPPSATEQVTRDHILGSVTEVVLGVPGADVGLGSLVDRLGDMGVRQAWAGLSEQARESIRDWVGERAGSAAAAVLDLAASGTTAHVHVLALGLMLDVLHGEDAAAADVVEARRGWETGYRLPRISASAAGQIGAAARGRMRLLADTDPGSRHDVWRDTPEAFAIAGFPTGIERSPSHPQGYRARLADVARALVDALPSGPRALPAAGAVGELESAAGRLHAHDLAWSDHAGDTERVDMAVRLVRWLATEPSAPTAAHPPVGAAPAAPARTVPAVPGGLPDGVGGPADLGAALRRQVAVDGWVDRAVADVWSGSTHAEVATAYSDLCQVVLAARREHDRQFAELLADVTSRDVLPTGLLPVERVLVDVVEPLTRVAPVLLIVIDGMSAAVAAAVGDGISRLSWVEHVLAEGADVGPRATRAAVLAALPTMTRFSRTSLLCGRLREGTQVDEKRDFAVVTGGSLFHKDDLRAPAGAAVNPQVSAAIASPAKVVGVVLNTVDDTLAKHDPDGTRWSVDTIQHLAPLLEVARQHGRTVVITSDHGHVVERGGRSEPRQLADTRWRPAATGPAGPDEVLLTGSRVLAGGGSIVAPWVEDLRYGHKAAGYHGGASAAEVTIPLLVFAGNGVDLAPAGWQPAGEQAPSWWEGAAPAVAVTPPAAAPVRPRRRVRSVPTQDGEGLFAVEPREHLQTIQDTHQVTPTDDAAADLLATGYSSAIDACLGSSVYQRTRAAAGRGALSDAAVRQVLRLLLAGGGRAPAEQVARALGVPPGRLQMALAGLRRLLNVEGYQVVSMDPDGRTVVLDEPLWRTQFGVTDR